MSRKIKLTQGKHTLVDNEDYEILNHFKWYTNKIGSGWYAVSYIGGKRVAMHREILGLETGDKRVVDHIDHNSLNNQRSNMRICTHQQNSLNQNSHSDAISPYVGVSRWAKHKKWIVYFWLNGKNVYLGSYDNEIEAARVHDRAALKYRGEFAKLNFPNEVTNR